MSLRLEQCTIHTNDVTDPLEQDDYYVYLCPPYWKRPDNLSGYMKKVKDGKARTDVIDDAAYTTTSLWNSILYKSNPAAKKISLDDAANSPPDVYKLAQDKGVSKSIANGMWMLNNIPSLTKIPLPAGISTKRKRSRLTIIDDPIPDTEAPAPALAKAKRADNPTPTGPFETIITRTSSVSYAYENQATESWFTVESSYDSNADPTIAPEELSAFLMPTVPAGAGQTGAPVCQVGNYADQATCGSACDGGTCKEDPTASFDPWKCSCV
ncbi:uncharacterized protein KY384_005666 [Bacidia gigantensis]|uniref:uncharacterized protein n=1 Tax=Bacidia gigantensis TaxID=2732470 RepID=UPI001D049B34|nr:uncharacterized protein KY384_005666 [Bacidia gigantensis]KAG8530183.1 hypothetical protein KY384_005666 [Bacidia gigantensis]